MPVLLLLFVASGASGLICQQLWLRLLSLVFGVTVYAAATTLASFLGGLALGGLLAGRLADRVRSPLRLLGFVELGVGVFALATPWALAGVQAAWVSWHATLPDGGPAIAVARFLCAGAVLLVPTTLMGASLPIIVRSSLLRGGAAGPRVSALYAANTAGALAGTLLCGLVLIEAVGIQASFRVAASLNLVAGLLALVLARHQATRTLPASASAGHAAATATHAAATATHAATTATHAAATATHAAATATHEAAADALDTAWTDVAVAARRDGGGRLLLATCALSGFVALALEVLWFRALLGVINATTSSFTFMLAAVLAGIAGGSALASLLSARRPGPVGKAWLQLALLQLLLAVMLPVSFGWLGSATSVHAWLFGPFDPHVGNGFTLPAIAAALAILPAALLMGLSFPLGLRLFVEGAPDVARRTGVFCAFNLCGGLAGALVAGFGLLPHAALDSSVLWMSAVSFVAGLALLVPVSRAAPRQAGIVAAAACALFALAAFSMGNPLAEAWHHRHPAELQLEHVDGAQTSVDISRREDGVTVMYLDGLHQANDSAEMLRYHSLIGHWGLLLHPKPRRVLCIGLGGGVTAGAAAAHPDVEVDIVELSDTVVSAAWEYFEAANGYVLDRPNVHLRVDDGRNWLAVSGRRYDVITADLIQPRHAGAGNLYSVEYFRLARAALNEGGLMVQWVSEPGSESWRLIVRTFLEAFPDATLWCDGTLLVGSTRPFELRPEVMARKLASPEVLRIAREMGFFNSIALMKAYTSGPDELRAQVGDGPLLTDDHPLLEYDLTWQAGRAH